MITQQINLYQDRFREKRLLVSANQVVMMLAVLLLGVAGWSYLIQSELDDSKRQNIILKASQATVNAELAVANAELNQQLSDDRMTRQITDLSKEIHARKQVIRFVENNQFGSGKGFSSYLMSLSNLQVNNVWLDEISLANGFVKISGSALSADLVPTYFAEFSEEAVFRGQRFQLFELNRTSATDWKVDFTIATEEALGE